MFTISEDIRNGKVYAHIKQLEKVTKVGVKTALVTAGPLIVKKAQQGIQDPPKTGRVYLRKLRRKNVRHQASAPGEYPANFSGNLQKKTGFKTTGQVQLIIGNSAKSKRGYPYAKALEEGNGRIKPRPYLQAAAKFHSGTLQNLFCTEINKVLNKL